MLKFWLTRTRRHGRISGHQRPLPVDEGCALCTSARASDSFRQNCSYRLVYDNRTTALLAAR